MVGVMSLEENLKMGRYPASYIYWIKSPKQTLFYFGAKHVFVNSKDFQLDILKHYFSEFLNITGKRNCVVVIEGLKRRVVPDATEEEEKKRGEMQFSAFLAEKAGIEHICVEPPTDYEMSLLDKEFSQEEIMTYYFIRSIQNWIRRGKDIPFDDYTKRVLDKYKDESGWVNFDFSIDNILRSYKQIVGEEFNYDNKDLIEHLENPYHTDNIVSKVSRRSGEIRDEYIVSELTKMWNDGKNIFTVYGLNHAIVQEPALRSLLK